MTKKTSTGDGTAFVTNGLATVVGSPTADWGGVGAQSVFGIEAVGAVPLPLSGPAFYDYTVNRWKLNLAANWAGLTNAALNYVLYTDYLPNGTPLANPGDDLIAQYNRMAAKFDAYIGLGVGPGAAGLNGGNGWSPELAVVSDGERRVLKLINWMGGSGAEPSVNKYVGAIGFVTDIASGVDIRGAAGAAGSSDTTPPVVSSQVLAADGVTLTILISESSTGSTGFTAKVNGTTRSSTAVRTDGTHVVLTLATAALATDTVTLNYAPGNVADASANSMAAFTGNAVTNNSTQGPPDTTAPTVTSRTLAADGVSLNVITSEPSTGYTGFVVKVNGTVRSATGSRGGGMTQILLALSTPALATDTVTLDYAPGNVTDNSANHLAAFTGAAVINNSTQTGSSLPVPVDAVLDFHGGTTDALLTTAGLSGTYNGAMYSVENPGVEYANFRIRANTSDLLPKSIELNGATLTGITGKGIEISARDANDGVYEAISYHLPSGTLKAALAGYVTFNTTSPTMRNSDWLAFNSYGGYGVMQQTIDGASGNNQVRAHGDNGGAGGIGANITVTPGKKYWFTLYCDTIASICWFGLYDPLTSFTEIARSSVIFSGSAIATLVVNIGNSSIPSGGNLYEKLILAYDDNAVFPLGLSNPVSSDLAARDYRSNLMARWPLNDGLVNSNLHYPLAANALSSDFTLSWLGNPNFVSGPGGKGAADFDGSSALTTATSAFGFTSEDFSFCFWMSGNTVASGDYKALIAVGNATPGYQVYLSGSAEVIMDTVTGGVETQTWSPTGAMSSGWHHVAIVRSGTDIKIYIDGAATARPTLGSHANPTAGDALYLAASFGGAVFWTGQMRDLRCYHEALTAAKVARIAAHS